MESCGRGGFTLWPLRELFHLFWDMCLKVVFVSEMDFEVEDTVLLDFKQDDDL